MFVVSFYVVKDFVNHGYQTYDKKYKDEYLDTRPLLISSYPKPKYIKNIDKMSYGEISYCDLSSVPSENIRNKLGLVLQDVCR